MTEKIIVIPREVRGYGNIVDKKELDDYSGVQSTISESTATVFGKDMTVYTLEAIGYHLALTLASSSITYGGTTTCTATLTELDGDAVSGASIKFYVDNTLVSTQTTNSSGVATYTTSSSLGIGSHTVKIVYNDGTNDIVDTETLTVTKVGSVLTINTPALVYSDEFDVTGTLKDANNNALVGETVTLYWKVGSGTVQNTSATTGSGGAVTFHRSAPTSITQYKFYLHYNGNSTINSSNSSSIDVDVAKETSVLNMTSPTSGQNITPRDMFTVSGSLLDNDGQTISGASVTLKYYLNGSLISTKDKSVGSDGSFTLNTNVFSTAGSGKIGISYAGNTYYTAVSTEINVTVGGASYDAIVCTADKSILSYADGEKATLYAQLKKNGSNHSQSGVTITFKQGSTTLGTAQTNSSGLATLTNGYESIGAGDISITASDGTLVSETFAIRDAKFYDASSSSNVSKYTVGTGGTMSYDSTNSAYLLKVGSSNAEMPVTLTGITIDEGTFEADVKLSGGANNQVALGVGNASVRLVYAGTTQNASIHQQSPYQAGVSTNISLNTNWYHLQFKVENGTGYLTLKQGDTTVATLNMSVSSLVTSSNVLKIYMAYASNTQSYIKNITVL